MGGLSQRTSGRVIACLVAMAFLGVACGQAATGPATTESAKPTPRKVSFAIAVPVPDPGQVFVFAPKGAGYFADEGLDVDIVPNPGGGAAVKQVANGTAEFALSSPENLLNSIEAGMALRAFATLITHSIYSVGVMPNSPIRDYADLKGKKVGISAFTSGAYPMAQAALAEHGLDPKKDVQFTIVGNGGPAADAIKTGKVDVIVTTDTQFAIFETLGVRARYLPEPAAAKLPGDLLVTRTDLLQRDPDLAARFGRAVAKGVLFAQTNPEAAIGFYMKQFPDAAAGKSKQENVAIMQARLKNMQMYPEQKAKWGFIVLDRYNQVQKLGVEYGVIKKEQDLNQIMTNQLIDRIDKFDAEKVKQDARAAR